MSTAVKKPLQARSQRTFDALLDATEFLLDQKPFSEISVAEIILRAGSSTGSFYARFGSKDDLIPALYDRYDAGLLERLEALSQSITTTSPTLKEICVAVVAAMAKPFEERPNLMRALTNYARVRTHEVQPFLLGRAGLLDRLVALFDAGRRKIVHPEPERAVRSALFLAGTAVREAILFPDTPLAASSGSSSETIKPTAAHALFAYLTTRME